MVCLCMEFLIKSYNQIPTYSIRIRENWDYIPYNNLEYSTRGSQAIPTKGVIIQII